MDPPRGGRERAFDSDHLEGRWLGMLEEKNEACVRVACLSLNKISAITKEDY